MGLTGSNYFEKWMSSDNGEQDKYTILQEKLTALEQKHETFAQSMTTTLSEITVRLATAENRSSTMMFQQEEPECDIVVIH
jgi:hypothetical protein